MASSDGAESRWVVVRPAQSLYSVPARAMRRALEFFLGAVLRLNSLIAGILRFRQWAAEDLVGY